jgi:magnesium transporter
MVGRELLAGLLIGVALTAVTLPLVWLRWSDVNLAVSVAVSVFAASSTATLVAMALPSLFDAFSLDPAFGSGPLGTVLQDLLSIWIYLSVTSLVMS